MEVLYIVLMLLVLAFSIFSLISYFSSRGSLKKRHARVMAELEPARHLNADEQDAFERLYKKRPASGAPVYRVEGALEYVGLSVQGAESKEFFIGGVRIAMASVARLSKKDIKLSLEQMVDGVDQEALQKQIEQLQRAGRKRGASEEEIGQRMADKIKSALFHTAEIVFLSEDIQRDPAYLVALDDWKLTGK
ncbi:MAG: hypothetical protein JXR96_12005 [Deltaproteobacteria bacterium]|nr:hypothetical protein [Deltaproteobacteria bacterium]